MYSCICFVKTFVSRPNLFALPGNSVFIGIITQPCKHMVGSREVISEGLGHYSVLLLHPSCPLFKSTLAD
jgi:hypothetical protein